MTLAAQFEIEYLQYLGPDGTLVRDDLPQAAHDTARLLELARDRLSASPLADSAGVSAVHDRVIVLRQGRAVEAGPMAEVFRAPVHAYTRGLIAAARRLDAALEGRE